MKKKKLLQRIEELEECVARLEARPPIVYYYYPIDAAPAPSWTPTVTWGSGTGDPPPDLTKVWCASYEDGLDG